MENLRKTNDFDISGGPWVQVGPKGPKVAQDGPGTAPRRPKSCQDGIKMAPVWAKIKPRGPKMRQYGPTIAPRWPPDGPICA